MANSMEIDEDWEEWNPTKGTFLHHTIAGSFAGLIEHVSIFPIDTIKTHMQCQQCPSTSITQNQTATQTLRTLIQTEGPMRLFRGVSSMIGSSIPAHAAYFSIFEACKQTFGAAGPEHTPIASGAAGIGATVAHDMIMTPMDVVKQRLQLGYYTGTLNCMKTIVQQEGLRALYISFPTTLLMNIPYGMVMVSSNETIKKVLNPTGEHNVSAYLLAGAISGALAGAFTNPLDVAKTRLQTQTMETECVVMQECVSRSVGVQVAGASPGNVETMASKETLLSKPRLRLQYLGLVDALSQVKATEGYAGWFRGVGPRVLVHAPSVAVSWTAYEVIKNLLQGE